MRRLQDVGWHIIGLTQYWVTIGKVRIELRGDAMWVVPAKGAGQ